MIRIYITGSAASGKTTYAKKLAEKLNIPLYSTDNFYDEVLDRTLPIEVIRTLVPIESSWIIEGAYYLPEYIHAADKVVFLRTTRINVFARIWRRWFTDSDVRSRHSFIDNIRFSLAMIRNLHNSDNIELSDERPTRYKNEDQYRLVKAHAKVVEEIWN
jgi:adenylate kinase family enzyme